MGRYLFGNKKYEKAYNLMKGELENLGSLEEKEKCYYEFFEVLKKEAEFQSQADFGVRWGIEIMGSLVDIRTGARVLADLGKEYGFVGENWKEYKKRRIIERGKTFYNKISS